MKYLILILFSLLFSRCNNPENRTETPKVQLVEVYVNPLEKRIDSLMKKSLIYGDTNAYYELSGIYYFRLNKSKELFFMHIKWQQHITIIKLISIFIIYLTYVIKK